MDCKDNKVIMSSFQKEVREGLTAFPKSLSSKYFYDEVGDGLFQEIMNLPEYYLTRAEQEIFETHRVSIVSGFDQDRQGFDLIELGAGDGKKTKVLLNELDRSNYDFAYCPVDISKNAVDGLVSNLASEMPNIKVNALVGEYFEVLDRLNSISDRKKVVMVLGSNIGNLLHPKAIEFLTKLQNTMHKGDFLFIGFDQKKHPKKVLDAYNDQTGITAKFNKNVLSRINKELGGDFDTDKFLHWETYNPESGTAKSYLVSKEKQVVHINDLSLEVKFEAWETIHTEISQKYDDSVVSWLVNQSNLEIVTAFSDKNGYYKDYLITKNNV